MIGGEGEEVFDTETGDDAGREVTHGVMVDDDGGVGFTALVGGDLADLTKGKDKRDTVALRGGGFLVEKSSSSSDVSQEEEGDTRSLDSDESYKRVESLDLIRGVDMKRVVWEERELRVEDIEERGCWVVKGGETEVGRMRMSDPGWQVNRGDWLSNPDVREDSLAAFDSTGSTITWVKEETFKAVKRLRPRRIGARKSVGGQVN